jgi:hypothetical protein
VALIHVFLDNARYHHAKLVQDWLARPFHSVLLSASQSDRAVVGLMHRNVTHNKTYEDLRPIRRCGAQFPARKSARNWADFCDSVTDNFRVINPKDFRVVT